MVFIRVSKVLVGCDVFKLFESAFYIALNKAVKFAFIVVPLEVDANILFRIKVKFGYLFFTNGAEEVINFLFLMYLIPKLSTTRVKEMSKYLLRKRLWIWRNLT